MTWGNLLLALASCCWLFGCATARDPYYVEQPLSRTAPLPDEAKQPTVTAASPRALPVVKVALESGMVGSFVEKPGSGLVSLVYVNRAARLGEDYSPTYVADALRAGASREDRSVLYPVALAGRAPLILTNPSGTTISLTCRPGELDEALELLAAMVQRPLFDANWLVPVRSRTMIDLLHLRDTYWDWWLARRHQGLPFRASSEAIAEKVGRLDQPALAQLHRELFRPGSSALVAVGDVSAAQMRAAFARRFGGWQGAPLEQEAGKAADAAPPAPRPPRTGRKIAVFDESGYPFVTLLQDAPPPESKDAVAFELLTEILSSSGEASLISKLRFEHGHAYSAWAGTITVPGSGRYLLLRTAVAAETLVQDLTEMLGVLERHRTTLIELETLEGAKALYGGQLALALASASGVAGYLARVELGATPPLEQVQARLAAVTPSDLQRVAQRYLNPDLATVVVTGKVTQAVRALGKLGEVSVE